MWNRVSGQVIAYAPDLNNGRPLHSGPHHVPMTPLWMHPHLRDPAGLSIGLAGGTICGRALVPITTQNPRVFWAPITQYNLRGLGRQIQRNS